MTTNLNKYRADKKLNKINYFQQHLSFQELLFVSKSAQYKPSYDRLKVVVHEPTNTLEKGIIRWKIINKILNWQVGERERKKKNLEISNTSGKNTDHRQKKNRFTMLSWSQSHPIPASCDCEANWPPNLSNDGSKDAQISTLWVETKLLSKKAQITV